MGEGSLVVAQQQTSGRGQRGNRWADTGDDGLAFSMCLAATTEPGRSALLAAAIVDALEDLVPGRLSLKHPNDVLLDGRKLAGVLIEQGRGIAVIGIGINVSQASWPTELEGAAISLAPAGLDIGRLSVLERVLCPLVAAWG